MNDYYTIYKIDLVDPHTLSDVVEYKTIDASAYSTLSGDVPELSEKLVQVMFLQLNELTTLVNDLTEVIKSFGSRMEELEMDVQMNSDRFTNGSDRTELDQMVNKAKRVIENADSKRKNIEHAGKSQIKDINKTADEFREELNEIRSIVYTFTKAYSPNQFH